MNPAEELLERIGSLTPGPVLDLALHIDEFPEVKQAFTIPNTKLWLAPDGHCSASLDDGGSIELVGSLYVEERGSPKEVLQFHRQVRLAPNCAEHKWLKVAPWCRGVGISSAFLLRSFDLYRQLGVGRVELEAQMETGKWHWARVGFDFRAPRDLEMVRGWAEEVTNALALDGAPAVDTFTSATQFARMTARREITLEELAAALPHKGDQARVAAETNFIQMSTPIALGRAIMLTGPSWNGYLDLEGPEYAQFRIYAESRRQQADRILAP